MSHREEARVSLAHAMYKVNNDEELTAEFVVAAAQVEATLALVDVVMRLSEVVRDIRDDVCKDPLFHEHT
jgi:hypothetical protein